MFAGFCVAGMLAGTSGQAMAQQAESTNRVAAKTDWSVFVEQDPNECWSVSAPKETVNTRDGRVVAVRRSDILLFVFFRPGNEAKGQVTFTGGYPFAPGSTVNLDVGGTQFNAFVDIAPASKWGSWGAWRYGGDLNPRAATLMAHASLPGPGASDAFRQGVYRDAGIGPDELIGTAQEDLLIGRGGDDTFRPNGGDDLIHGGAGEDVVLLTGMASDWLVSWVDDTAVFAGPTGTARLTAVEFVEFLGDGRRFLLAQEAAE